MAQIFVVRDITAFRSNPIFSPFSGNLEERSCVVWPSMDGLEKLVTAGVLEAVPNQGSNEAYCSAFIQDYTALIAQLNLTYKDKFLWWATDISSKNRYTSPLPEMIEELNQIDQAARKYKGQAILIIAPSIGIYKSLQKAMIKEDRKLLWPQAPQKEFQEQSVSALKYLARIFLNALRFYSRSLWARLILGGYARRCLSPQKEFYVIKTFSYPNSWDKDGDYADPFFGRLPRVLSQDKNVLVLTYHWQGYREYIKRIFREKTLMMFPVEFFIKGSDILRAMGRILSFSLPVPQDVHFRDLEVADIIRFELARTLNGIQIFQLLHYDALRHMLNKIHVETFLFTFENNPWERMCIRACRNHSPLTKVLGYQHSVVPQAALNMFVHPQERLIVPLPHSLITTGEVPTDMIKQYGNYSATKIEIGCGLRYEYLHKVEAGTRNKQGPVLIILDGVWDTHTFIRYCLLQIGKMQNQPFVIRAHPALPWVLLSAHYGFSLNLYPNVKVSKRALIDDLNEAKAVIYWQSTVALEALRLGRPVINFNPEAVLSFDPIKSCSYLRKEISPFGSLKDVLEDLDSLSDQEYELQKRKAKDFIENYFHPVTDQSLNVFKA